MPANTLHLREQESYATNIRHDCGVLGTVISRPLMESDPKEKSEREKYPPIQNKPKNINSKENKR